MTSTETEHGDRTPGGVAALREVRARAVAGPSERATRAQHAKGKLTARERIELLLDPGSFREVEQLRRHRARGFGLEAKKPHTDGVVTGWGTVEGRTVFVYANDFRIFGGALGEAHATKIHKLMDMALTTPRTSPSRPCAASASGPGCSRGAGRWGGCRTRGSRTEAALRSVPRPAGPSAVRPARPPSAGRARTPA